MSIHDHIDNSEFIAYWDNGEFQTDQHWYQLRLYKHRGGNWFVVSFGGCSMRRGEYRWIKLDEAREFVARHANCGMTGYEYSAEEVERVLAGESVRASGDEYPERPEAREWV